MSAENVELISALQPDPDVDLVEFFRDRQAWSNLMEAIGAIFHPDVESGFVRPGDASTNRGVEGFRQTWVEWLGPWESYRAEIESVEDYGDNILVITNDYGRQPGMTAEVRLLGAAVWTLREGQVARAYFYVDRAVALNDARRAILDGE
jgi:hypothetical protein